MSNIYIQEPPSKGKVILKTTLGDIEIELWSKEAPKACRNFVQLCMEGYYDNTIFHRIIKDFIAQGGDPTGTGQGGESIYGQPFKDEFHTRLRFNRRGLVAMASSEIDDNGSQFFFTLDACPELNKKNTIFGKVVGNTLYNMIKLNECECINERPVRAEKIISAEVVYNPFEDIKPRNLRASAQKSAQESDKDKESQTKKPVKNFGLLSFGEEAEEEEDELESFTKGLKSKSKSAHDVGDPTLISKKALEKEEKMKKMELENSQKSNDEDDDTEERETKNKVKLDEIKSKLARNEEKSSKSVDVKTDDEKKLNQDELKRKQTQEEIRKIQKELAMSKKKKENEEEQIKLEHKQETEVVLEYKKDVEKYEHLKNKKLKKDKEDKTMELLNAFRERLHKAKETSTPETTESPSNEEDMREKEPEKQVKPSTSGEKLVDVNAANASDSFSAILTHKLELTEEIKMKVIDANVADMERYDIYDPRNPLNKRKRDESREITREKKMGNSMKSSL